MVTLGEVVAETLRLTQTGITGSNPVLIAMSKRYSESLNQDLNNDSAECLRRERDIVGTKESNTPPPSSVDFF